MKSSFYGLFIALVALFVLSGCQDESPTPDQPLTVSVTAKVGSANLDTNGVYTLGSTAARVRMTTVQTYISELKLVRNGGDTVRLTDEYILHYAQLGATKSYTLPAVPAGDYTHVVFNLGISAPKNTQSGSNPANPNNYPSGHPLNYAVAPPTGAQSMYWSWNSGYLFHRVEGFVDTSATGTGGALTAANAAVAGSSVRSLVYHVGTNANARVISKAMAFAIAPGSSTLAIDLDYADVFAALDLKLNRDTHSFGTTPVGAETLSKAAMATAAADGAVTGTEVR